MQEHTAHRHHILQNPKFTEQIQQLLQGTKLSTQNGMSSASSLLQHDFGLACPTLSAAAFTAVLFTNIVVFHQAGSAPIRIWTFS